MRDPPTFAAAAQVRDEKAKAALRAAEAVASAVHKPSKSVYGCRRVVKSRVS